MGLTFNSVNYSFKYLQISIIVIFVINTERIRVESFVYHDDKNISIGRECNTTSGRPGFYRREDACKQAKSTFDPNDFHPLGDGSLVVCCKLRPIERICEYYYPRNIRFTQFFAGGKQTLADQQPHMAALGWNYLEDEIDWRCGASIITVNFLITAAHCSKYQDKPPDIARTGDLNLRLRENNTYARDHNILQVYVHPKYKSYNLYHDIALMKLSPDFILHPGHLPACIWPDYDIPRKEVIGMGYGTLSFSGILSNELHEGTLQLQSHQECVRNMPSTPDIPHGISRRQLCAIDPKHVVDTCQGDSGGPLQFYHKIGKRWRTVIVGITSFGLTCAGSTPGVYTRVSEYVDWMEPILMSDFHVPGYGVGRPKKRIIKIFNLE